MPLDYSWVDHLMLKENAKSRISSPLEYSRFSPSEMKEKNYQNIKKESALVGNCIFNKEDERKTIEALKKEIAAKDERIEQQEQFIAQSSCGSCVIL